MLPLTTIVFALSYVAGCVGSLRYPLMGLLVYIMTYFTYPEMAWWTRPIAWIGQRYCFVASLFLGIGFFVNWHRGRWGRQFWHRQEILFVILVGIMWISMFVGADPCTTSYKQMDKMAKVLLLVLLFTHVVNDVRGYRVVIWALIIGTFHLGYLSYTAGPSSFRDGRLNNIGGPDFDRAPELGIHFVAMLPLIGAMLLSEHRRWVKGVLVVIAGLTCNGLILTRTRSAMTAIIAGVLYALWKVPIRWRGHLVGLGVLGAIGAYSLTDEGFWERIATIPSTFEAESQEVRNSKGLIVTSGRIPTWKAAWAMWQENPLGVGIGNFTRLIGNYPPVQFPIDAHNTFVLCMAELGFFGIVVFLAIVVGSFSQINRMKHLIRNNPSLEYLRLDVFGLETALFAFLVGGLTVSRFYCEMFWWLIALPICLERAIAHELSVVPAVEASEQPKTKPKPKPAEPEWTGLGFPRPNPVGALPG